MVPLTSGFNMPLPKTVGSTVTKEAAINTVEKLINDEECMFHLVEFSDIKKTFQGYSLRSAAYEKYYVLFHGKSHYHSGWFLCSYVKNGI